MSTRLTLVIVHYQNKPLLLDQLAVLDSKKFEIIVVDNSDLLTDRDLPEGTKLISNPQNIGFAGACNRGAAVATGNWLVFLNPDVQLTNRDIEDWIDYAEKHGLDASSPQPESENYQKPLPSTYSLLREFTPLGKFLPPIKSPLTLTGGALLIKRSVIETLGGWDERFFLWFEDSDLTKRLLDHQYQIGFFPGKIKHLGGQSLASLSDQTKKAIFFTSMKNYAQKHFGPVGNSIISLIKKRFTSNLALPILNPNLVSLVVPNLKIDLLDSFLTTNQQYLKNPTLELIIVSSALNSSNIWLYRKKHPDVRFIPITANQGFAKTVNIGFNSASGKYLGTVNDDVILSKDWLKSLIAQLKKHPGSVNPVILDKNGQIETAGIGVLPIGKALPTTKIKSSKPYFTDATNGACVIYSKTALEKVGLFDEKFGSYLEDIDLALRLSQAGYHNSIVPTTSVTHLKHQTTNSISLNKTWLDLKNWWLVIIKNWSFQTWFRFWPQILLERGRNLSGYFKSHSNRLPRIAFILVLISLFIFLRLYKIQTSLLFFNDIGRDFLELLNWQQSGKPPLLGPQTSALPYNQSAFYYYLLYPLFIITNHSPFATILTCALFYLAILIGGLLFVRHEWTLKRSLLLAFLLITIHPQFIIQNRFVWNPSFVGPLILMAFYAFMMLKKRFSLGSLAIFSLTISLATSLNYSIAPLLIAFMLLALTNFIKQARFFVIWLATGLSLLFWNLPTVVFELRHHFLLTNLLIHGEKLKQTAVTLSQKTADTLHFAFYNLSFWQSLLLVLLITLLVLFNLRKKINWHKPLVQALALLAITVLITLAVPISMQAHYVFAILTMLIIVISLLSNLSFMLIFLFLASFYLKPSLLTSYFQPAARSVSQTQACAAQLCSIEQEPFFVSVQASTHPYHNGMEFKYLFKNAGCQIKELDTQINDATRMAVVVDDSIYEHNKTAYNELTQFGPSQEIRRHQCEANLEVVMIEKLVK